MEIPNEYKKNIYRTVITFIVIVSVFFLVKIYSEIRSSDNSSDKIVNTINLSGHGEVTAVPDIANIYFTISKDSKTVKDAQALVAQVEKSSLDFLKGTGIADKDIKTADASFTPKYQYRYDTNVIVPCTQYNCPPPTGNNVVVGYTASESITIKVRNIDDVGKIMQGLGGLGVTNLSGPNFAIDNQDGLKAEARKKAIDDARTKAVALAKDLGVKLGKITSFNESGNYPTPMMYDAKMSGAVNSVSSAPAQIPTGENTISSDVTITYEIK